MIEWTSSGIGNLTRTPWHVLGLQASSFKFEQFSSDNRQLDRTKNKKLVLFSRTQRHVTLLTPRVESRVSDSRSAVFTLPDAPYTMLFKGIIARSKWSDATGCYSRLERSTVCATCAMGHFCLAAVGLTFNPDRPPHCSTPAQLLTHTKRS